MPGVMKVPANGLDIFVKRDFLTRMNAPDLIKLIDAECYPPKCWHRPQIRNSGPATAAT
jgi:hypothetical protein